jgi:anthranilate synthase
MPCEEKTIFEMSGNYTYTDKYKEYNIKINKISIEFYIFGKKLYIVPKSLFGDSLIKKYNKKNKLKKTNFIYYYEFNKISPRIITKKMVDIAKITGLKDPFGIYGFFTYENINLINKEIIENQLYGVFYAPEKIIINGKEFSYAKENNEKSININKKVLDFFEKNLFFQKNSFIQGKSLKCDDYFLKIKNKIDNREIISINPSYLIEEKTKKTPEEIFQYLKERNKSPYNIYMKIFDFYLIGSSPCMFLRSKNKIIETSPICGTIKRGKNEKDDEEKIKLLLSLKKEDFELAECIKSDLLCKNCCKNLKIVKRKEIEKFSTVFHTSAHISCKARRKKDIFRIFEDHIWPTTTLGTPKQNAFESIYENELRNWYSGAFGYFTVSGNIDFCIIIRSGIYDNKNFYTRVGSSITEFSSNFLEKEELKIKANTILKAL